MQPGLDRLRPDGEAGCRRGGAQAFDLAQHEHAAEFLWERIDRCRKQLAQLAARGQPLGIWLFGGEVGGEILLVAAVAPSVGFERDDVAGRTQASERLVGDDAGEPGRERLGLRKLAEPGVGTYVGLLQHVLGLGVALEEATGEPEQAAIVPPHDQLEGKVIATACPGDQLAITELRPTGAVAASRRRRLGTWLCHAPRMTKP